MRRVKRSFEKKKIDKDRKSFFAYMRNRSRSKPTVGPLMDIQDGSILQPREMIEELNEYFTSVLMIKDSVTMLGHKLLFTGNEEDKLTDIEIDEDMVKKILDSIRTDKVVGVDDFSPPVLVELYDVLYLPLTLMNASLKTVAARNEWKAAYVTPIHVNAVSW